MQEKQQQFLCTAMQNIHQILLEKSWNQYKTQRIENDDKAENRWSERIDRLHFSLSTDKISWFWPTCNYNLLEAIRVNIFILMSMYLKFETSCSLSNIHPSPLLNFGSGFLGQEVKILSTGILSAADSLDDIFNPPWKSKILIQHLQLHLFNSVRSHFWNIENKWKIKISTTARQQLLWNRDF